MSSRVRDNRLRNRLFRKGQTGQSLILLAIGFIALLAFVGIVTDISLLFVRYSTLRRAVDAAAVAAAGQMRRVPNADGSSIGNPESGLNNDEGQAVSVANLNLAARQFIEVYGLNPEQVIAETCYAQVVRRDGSGRPLDRNGVLLYNYSGTTKTGPNGGANGEDRARYEELCKDNELKLVRVTAQIDSPTVFLRLLGVPSITLTESSISQTAVLDVVLILDVSESMAFDTTYNDWQNLPVDLGGPYAYRYVPPKVGQNNWDRWPELINNSMNQIMALTNPDGTLRYGISSVEIASTADPDTGNWMSGPTVAFLPDGITSSNPTRAECQVRVAPTTVYNTGADIPPWLRQEYVARYGQSWVADRFDSDPADAGAFRGFLPMYRSYACCNDPNGDFDFADLVCQPFQNVRAATSQFLSNLDFIRGDRVAFVTFDNTAHIVDPDGPGGQSPMIEVEYNLNPNGDTIIDTSANERHGAQEILRSVVGVRAEPTYYADNNNDGRWDGLMEYDPSMWDPSDPNSAWQGKPWSYFQTTPMGNIYVQPSISSCFLDRAILIEPQVPEYYHGRQNGSGRAVWSLLTDAVSSPNWFWDTSAAIPGDAYWENLYFSGTRPELQSAEYRGGCGSGNIGSGIAGAQQALIDGGRTEGAVWLMVLLSDGASGVTDPIQRTSGGVLNYPNVYNQVAADAFDPIPGDYGVFGACPYGTDAGNRAELLNPGDRKFPFCSDKEPSTRHFCSSTPMLPTLLTLDSPDCDRDFYDADDYAHDWADWIALANIQADERQSNEQLPTLFTIGIGLDFSPIDPSTGTAVCADTDWGCRRNQEWTWEDYLGEQLLRYIADVGDNNQIDDDYWQCVMQERIPNSVYRLDPNTLVRNCDDKTLPEWGPRGPCERQSIDPAAKGIWAPLDPQVSCGNYFAASTSSDLERVFSIIASRMFTRLSQ